MMDFVDWLRETMNADCSAFMQEFARRFEASGRSFAVYEMYELRVRFMHKAYDEAQCPKDSFWKHLELVRRVLARHRVVPEGVW